MRLCILVVIFGGLAFGQTHELCYRVTGETAVERCITLSPELRDSLNKLNISQGTTVQVGTPQSPRTEFQLPYVGLDDMVFGVLNTALFGPALDKFPTAAVQALKVSAEEIANSIATQMALDLPDPPNTPSIAETQKPE